MSSGRLVHSTTTGTPAFVGSWSRGTARRSIVRAGRAPVRCGNASAATCRSCAAACPRARPGFILFVQTFGALVNFNPHVHALVADGVFEASGRFIPLPPIPEALLAERLRREVLRLLVRREAIPPQLAGQMLAWRHSGFSVHNQVRVAAGDAEDRKSLAG